MRYILGLLELLLARRPRARSTCARTCTTTFNEHVDAENQPHGVGLVRREQLVQERARPRRAELAVHAARVLAAHAARPTPTTTSSSTAESAAAARQVLASMAIAVAVHAQRRDVQVPAARIADVRLRRTRGTRPSARRSRRGTPRRRPAPPASSPCASTRLFAGFGARTRRTGTGRERVEYVDDVQFGGRVEQEVAAAFRTSDGASTTPRSNARSARAAGEAAPVHRAAVAGERL